MRISDWSSDVCSSDLRKRGGLFPVFAPASSKVRCLPIESTNSEENMRNLKLIIGVVAAICSGPTAANAQSLDQVIGVIGGASSLGYNPCSYVSGDTAKTLCQINRAARLANDARNVIGDRGTQKYWDGNDKGVWTEGVSTCRSRW